MRDLVSRSETERPSFLVTTQDKSYGKVLVVLSFGPASEQGSGAFIYSGRVRPGEPTESSAWLADARASAESRWNWFEEADFEGIRNALEGALAAFIMRDADRQGSSGGEQLSTAELIVRLAETQYQLGVSTEGEPFAVERNGPNIAISLRGAAGALRARLARDFRNAHGRTPSSSVLADAMTVLAGQAQDCESEEIHLRVAPLESGVVIDLGDAEGRAVVVDESGWHVVNRSPVRFKRTALTAPFPLPASGGRVEELWSHITVAEEDRELVLGWLLHAFIPGQPHAVLFIGGEKGSGKTTQARRLVSLTDPSGAVTRSEPRNARQFAISVAGSWVVAFDNLSQIPGWLSDAICRAATGDGWVDRALYTDEQLTVLRFQRVMMITSIDAGDIRGDLAERMLIAELARIELGARRTQSELDASFNAARPRILGALLTLLSKVFAKFPEVTPENLPRMADFARVLATLDDLRGSASLSRYVSQEYRIAEEVVEGDSVALAVIEHVRSRGSWSGTAKELLAVLGPKLAHADRPKTPRALSGCLNRARGELFTLGIVVEPPGRNDRPRIWKLRASDNAESPTDATDGSSGSLELRSDGLDGEVEPISGDTELPSQLDSSECSLRQPREGPEGDTGEESV